jgi:hypothetical protein
MVACGSVGVGVGGGVGAMAANYTTIMVSAVEATLEAAFAKAL